MDNPHAYVAIRKTKPALPPVAAVEVELSTAMIAGTPMLETVVRIDGREVLRTWSAAPATDADHIVDTICRATSGRPYRLAVSASDQVSQQVATNVQRIAEAITIGPPDHKGMSPLRWRRP
ncbi:hypothetical protein [Cupriavidus metallidurans]|uniref:hypothetical protein n=1 Tax=Cupriavidus metallidurans TaxID=119219 RepID=UPI0005628593|nr:hypothetical protein [Cupriavidus metallidurans]